MASKQSDAAAAMARSYRLRGIIASAVIFVCIVFLVWLLWPKPAIEFKAEETPAVQWMRAYSALSGERSKVQDAFYWATSNVTLSPSADGQAVAISGKVKSVAELDLLKMELAKLQPTVPIDWKVVVGR